MINICYEVQCTVDVALMTVYSFGTIQSHIIGKRLKTRGCNKSWRLVKCAIYVKQNSLKLTSTFSHIEN